ncbi:MULTISPECIES: hypothetical protein [Pseudoalteromonas]|uniref:hypothetical protein n=1 Tax=Pseudoalteromonas TaxID=53246 RepID=UPI00031F3D53|nr:MULTISPECIES: hypothetical protein [Pseudoalteromonas]MCF6146239.1 hypothetical protein [Pseudoalteromonas mariniglutinosa NCIMB 1770]
MAILKHDNSLWPLAITVARGECTLEMHLNSLQAWDIWFKKAEPFVVVRVYSDEESLQHPKGAGPATQKWLKEGAAEQMQQHVQAMLIVVPEQQFERMQKMSVQKAFGIPGAVVKSLDDAHAWLMTTSSHNKTLEQTKLIQIETLVHALAT